MYKPLIKTILFTLFLIGSFNLVIAQNSFGGRISFGVQFGSTMLWGDLSDDSDPFSKILSKESSLSYGINFNYKLAPPLTLQGDFIFGQFTGERLMWSNNVPAGIGFKTDYFDYNLNLQLDLIGLLSSNTDNKLSIYFIGGAGFIHYKSNSFMLNNNLPLRSANDINIIAVTGGGIGYNISPKLRIYAQNTYRISFVDDLDSYIGSGSAVNDIYSFTNLGIQYRFGKKHKTEPIHIQPIEPDTNLEIASSYENVKVNVVMPKQFEPNETKPYIVNIQKGSLTEEASYNQSFPEGFTVTPIDTFLGVFRFIKGKLYVKWDSLPSVEDFKLTLSLSVGDLKDSSYTIPGTFVYTEQGEIKTIHNRTKIEVKSPQDTIAVIATELSNDQGESEEISDTMLIKKDNLLDSTGRFIFRVQIAAVYGGNLNPFGLQKQYKLSEQIYTSYSLGYSRYTIGNFNSYQEAEIARQNTNVRGAYVVVFKDGVYQTYLHYINQDIKNNTPFLSDGITYKIQLLANEGGPYPIVKIAAKYYVSNSSIYEEKTLNWYQYTVGSFNSYDEAKSQLEIYRKLGANDAFIVKYRNGMRF